MSYYSDEPNLSPELANEINGLKQRLAAAEARKHFDQQNEQYTRQRAQRILEEANEKLGLEGPHALTGSEAELNIQNFSGTEQDYLRQARVIARLRRDKLNAEAEKAAVAKRAAAEAAAKPITATTFNETLYRQDSARGPRETREQLKATLAKAEAKLRATNPDMMRKVGDL